MPLPKRKNLQERYSDPLLTALTVMLGILLFAVGPMQAAGLAEAHEFGIAFGLVLVAAVFVVSGSLIAFAAVLLAVGCVVAATSNAMSILPKSTSCLMPAPGCSPVSR